MDDHNSEKLLNNLQNSRDRRRYKMAKFLIVHPVGKELTLEAVTPVAKAIKANVTVDAYWTRSTYVREEGKLYCEWDGKDVASIKKIIDKAAPGFPTEIYKLDDEFMVHSESFR
jgi:hypothetical protein